jgi:hypothetical protein
MTHLISDRPLRPGVPRSETVTELTPKYVIYDGTMTHQRKHSRGMLDDLLQAKDSPFLIGKFCEKWGVLGLCKHGVPYRHDKRCWQIKPFRKTTVRGFVRSEFRESIQSIQQFANGLGSLLSIGSELSQGREGSLEDWQRAADSIMRWDRNVEISDLSDRSSVNLDTRKLYFEVFLNKLIDDCQLRPRLFRDGHSWRMEMDSGNSWGQGNNLAGLVVMELVITVAACDGFAICSSCKTPYMPHRRPDPTRRNYCPKCGRDAAVRDASRKYRQRRRDAGSSGKGSFKLHKTKKVK